MITSHQQTNDKIEQTTKASSQNVVMSISQTLNKTYSIVTYNKKAQLTQRERATAVHVWRPTAVGWRQCDLRLVGGASWALACWAG